MSNYHWPQSNTRTWAEIYHDPYDLNLTEEKTDYLYFEWFYNNCGVPNRLLGGVDYIKYGLEAIYFILTSRFANDHIKISDEQRFKLEVCSRIMQYGPQWQRMMVLQDKLLNLSDEDLVLGHTTIHNHAMHPDTEPSDQTLEELQYIDDQNVTKYKRDGIDAYSRLIPWLEDKATTEFLKHFENLFVVVAYGRAVTYVSDEEDI